MPTFYISNYIKHLTFVMMYVIMNPVSTYLPYLIIILDRIVNMCYNSFIMQLSALWFLILHKLEFKARRLIYL